MPTLAAQPFAIESQAIPNKVTAPVVAADQATFTIPTGWHAVLMLFVVLLMLVHMAAMAWSEWDAKGPSIEMSLVPLLLGVWAWLASGASQAMKHARALGAALLLDVRGVHIAGGPFIPWRFIRGVRWVGGNLGSPASLSWRVVVGPDLAAYRSWKWRFNPFGPRLSGDVLELDSMIWASRGNGYGQGLIAFVERVAPHVIAVDTLDVVRPAEPNPDESLREIDDARDEALALIAAGARSSDSALKNAWKRYDDLRARQVSKGDA